MAKLLDKKAMNPFYSVQVKKKKQEGQQSYHVVDKLMAARCTDTDFYAVEKQQAEREKERLAPPKVKKVTIGGESTKPGDFPFTRKSSNMKGHKEEIPENHSEAGSEELMSLAMVKELKNIGKKSRSSSQHGNLDELAGHVLRKCNVTIERNQVPFPGMLKKGEGKMSHVPHGFTNLDVYDDISRTMR
jgi:hypothetical protein